MARDIKPRETKPATFGRRSALAGAALLGTAGLIGAPFIRRGRAAPAGEPGPALVQPPVETSKDGLLQTAVDARYGTYDLGGQRVTLRSYGGAPVGHTLRLQAGNTLRLALSNHLPFDPLAYLCTAVPVPGENAPRGFNVTNMHVHGVHVSPNSPADNMFVMVRPGETQQYVYDIPADHPPGTYFYHAHFHGSVAMQVASGMSGALIIEGEVDRIPEIKAAEDVVLMFQTQRFNDVGLCEDYQTLVMGDAVYVNGQVCPTITMRPGQVQRWRMVNAAHQANMVLSLAEHGFTVLCLDGNPLPRTTEMAGIPMVPGNRADVLVKAGPPGLYKLSAGAPMGVVAYLKVEGSPDDMTLYSGDLPQVRALKPVADSEVTYGRRVEFDMAGAPPSVKYFINRQPFTCAEPWQIPLGAVEEWDVYNHTADSHPFHIHINPFQMLAGGNVTPGVWLDTVELPPFQHIRFRTRFSDYTGTFVLHCHNLVHEDMGMMQAIHVMPKSA
jgi:FtsP/CotA-like multicopper oxidase with cupredoxin domain